MVLNMSNRLESLPKIFLSQVDRRERLGQGSYGRVNRGLWNQINVAVKEFEIDDMETYDTELDQLATVNHPNIIRLLASSRDNIKFLVMEYADRGSLYKVLHSTKQGSKQVDYHSGHALSWCLQCAAGVEYLHNIKPHPIIHRDLKSPNLLLFSDGLILKICDFGTACNKRTIMTNNKGSAPWMAPEVFTGKNYSEKCDVFSFAIIMWEVFTRKLPFHDCCDNVQQIQWAKYVGRRPPKINKCPEELWKLMDRCWNNNIHVRPNMSDVVEVITALQPCFPDASVPLEFPEDEVDTADSSSYVSALTSLTSQEVDHQASLLKPCSDIDIVTAMYQASANNQPPNGVQFNNYRYGTPMEELYTEIPRLPQMDPNAWKNAPPGLMRERSLQESGYHGGGGATNWPGPPEAGSSDAYIYNYPPPPYAIMRSYSHMPYLSPRPSQPSPSIDRLQQGMDGMHLEQQPEARRPSPAMTPSTHYFQSFPNIIGNTYHPPSDSEEFFAPGWMGNPKNLEEKTEEAKNPTPTKEMIDSNEARAPYRWLSGGNVGYPTFSGLGGKFAENHSQAQKRQPNQPGLGYFLPRPPASAAQPRLSPYSNSPYEASPRGSQEVLPTVEQPSSQHSFRKGHRRSCSDGSSGDMPSLGWQNHQSWGRSYTQLPLMEEGCHRMQPLPSMPPPPHHPDYPYDTLDRDIDLINPDIRPTPPQPNCPQSMRIYEDSRRMAAALINVKMEAQQMQIQKANLTEKCNQTDAEFALSLVESDGSFPLVKEEVEKYYDLKAKKAALMEYHDQLREQYEEQQRQLKEESPTGDGSEKKSRNPFKRLFKKPGVPVPDPVQVESKCVEDWEWVDKSGEKTSNNN